MKKTTKTYLGIMLAGALSFSVAAEAANYTLNTQGNKPLTTAQQDNNGVPAFEKELLGPYADINKIPAADLRAAYITLLESVRSRSDNWTNAEWNKAQAVMKKLDARKKVVEKDLETDDKAKIKLLHAELRALETKKDIKD
ncbi:hypothetical protein H7F15_17180 [Pontibacter sp. Tf4]|uniref:hypothetical protein n=1 Tax=Pontibacter sp. Tf4 TaxID=2761620 RepID=UPI00162581CD|nr:hypothetical protein [Pontibacter sp. Tf4]MBB6612778.1 hypothetical protein [Pontibacter sp. Tf4]